MTNLSTFRSGFVAVVGRPNVGKSTLMNALVGEKIAIVSPKPQTTREQVLGILNRPDAQVVFVDTPGFHRPRTPLGEYMVETIRKALPDADLVLFVADLSEEVSREDREIAKWLARESGIPIFQVMNKADLVPPAKWEEKAVPFRDLLAVSQAHFVSATSGLNLKKLLDAILSVLPEGSPYYDPETLTDQTQRALAAEMVREQILHLTQEEVPHSVAVKVEEYKERESGITYISANIYVEKDSQKGILIGSGGAMLKEIGRRARQEIEAMVGGKVFLDLWVKVEKNWRKNPAALNRLGYPVSRKENR